MEIVIVPIVPNVETTMTKTNALFIAVIGFAFVLIAFALIQPYLPGVSQ